MRKMNCQHRNFTIMQTAEQRKNISQKENFEPTKQGIQKKANCIKNAKFFKQNYAILTPMIPDLD